MLRETHFYPFEMAVKKANVRTVMASYNEIDGVPNHANSWLLNDVLRGEWGFTGYVISDYDAVNRMFTRQHACLNQAEAGKRAINAGMDCIFVNHLKTSTEIQPTYTIHHLKELEQIL